MICRAPNLTLWTCRKIGLDAMLQSENSQAQREAMQWQSKVEHEEHLRKRLHEEVEQLRREVEKEERLRNQSQTQARPAT